MIGVVIVTHGKLAHEFRAALEHVVGPQEQIETISIGPDDDLDVRRSDMLTALARVDSGGGVVVLTDMFGGTPSNLGITFLADDAVEVRRRGETDLIGTCPELTRHHMEVRGLGVINIRDLFGVAATRMSKRMELVVQLERWDAARDYDRLGLDENAWELFGVRIPLVHMPVAPGRNLAILVEVAARNQLLRARGLNAARDLASRLDQQLRDDADGDVNADEDVEHGGPA